MRTTCVSFSKRAKHIIIHTLTFSVSVSNSVSASISVPFVSLSLHYHYTTTPTSLTPKKLNTIIINCSCKLPFIVVVSITSEPGLACTFKSKVNLGLNFVLSKTIKRFNSFPYVKIALVYERKGHTEVPVKRDTYPGCMHILTVIPE